MRAPPPPLGSDLKGSGAVFRVSAKGKTGDTDGRAREKG
jgi:hypothetical protein